MNTIDTTLFNTIGVSFGDVADINEILNSKIDISNPIRFVQTPTLNIPSDSPIEFNLSDPESLFEDFTCGNVHFPIKPGKLCIYMSGLACLDIAISEDQFDMFNEYNAQTMMYEAKGNKLSDRIGTNIENVKQQYANQRAKKEKEQKLAQQQADRLQKIGLPQLLVLLLDNGSFQYMVDSSINSDEICGRLYWRPTLLDICRIYRKFTNDESAIPLKLLISVNNNDNGQMKSAFMHENAYINIQSGEVPIQLAQKTSYDVYVDVNAPETSSQVEDVIKQSSDMTIYDYINDLSTRNVNARRIMSNFKWYYAIKVYINGYLASKGSKKRVSQITGINDIGNSTTKVKVLYNDNLITNVTLKQENIENIKNIFNDADTYNNDNCKLDFNDWYSLYLTQDETNPVRIHFDKHIGNVFSFGDIVCRFSLSKITYIMFDTFFTVCYSNETLKPVSMFMSMPEQLLNTLKKIKNDAMQSNSMPLDVIMAMFNNYQRAIDFNNSCEIATYEHSKTNSRRYVR